jgi:Xaa-Pro aminopeptidase
VDALATALRDLGTRADATVALDPSWTPVEVQQTLGARAVADLRPAVRSARLLKTEREIGLLREAARVCDAGHDRLLEVAAAGRNELEVMGDVLTRARARAASAIPVDRSTASSSAATRS